MRVEEQAPALGGGGAQELQDDFPRHRRRGEIAREARQVRGEDEPVSVADGGDLGEAGDAEEGHDDERRRDGGAGGQKRRDAPAFQDGPGSPVRLDRIEDPREIRNLRDVRRQERVRRAGDRRDEATVEIVGREAFGPDGRRGVRGGLEVPERRRRVRSPAEKREDVAGGRGVERERQPVGRRGREVEGRARSVRDRSHVGRLRGERPGGESGRGGGREGRQEEPERTPPVSQGSPPGPGAYRRSQREARALRRRRARAAPCAPCPRQRRALRARGRTRRRVASRPRRRTRSPRREGPSRAGRA